MNTKLAVVKINAMTRKHKVKHFTRTCVVAMQLLLSLSISELHLVSLCLGLCILRVSER